MEKIHFVRIITATTLREGKLMIPSMFAEKYGEGLPNTVFVKAPNGDEWKLNLGKGNGRIWLGKGWKEFAEHYSVVPGHCLLFKFEGTSHFQVLIFDMSALEIDYPLVIPCNDRSNNLPSHEILENQRQDQKGQKRKLRSCKTSNSKCAEVKNTLILPQTALNRWVRKCKEKSMVTAKTVTALDRASSFKSCNPFFFVVMRPSYLCPSTGVLLLPSEFCMTHFDLEEKHGDVDLQVQQGRFWPVRYLISKIKTKTKTTVRLTSGWKSFVKYYNLNIGDVCTFELIRRTKLTFQVHIFRETHNSNCSTS